jgi:hypothetical protein
VSTPEWSRIIASVWSVFRIVPRLYRSRASAATNSETSAGCTSVGARFPSSRAIRFTSAPCRVFADSATSTPFAQSRPLRNS